MSSGLKRGITTKGRPKRDALSGDRLRSALQTHLQGLNRAALAMVIEP